MDLSKKVSVCFIGGDLLFHFLLPFQKLQLNKVLVVKQTDVS